MFIKLTRLDNTPIWINASFVVTVEPRRGGGAIVVPIGDGLDYDVREAPEAVLALLGDAPAPTVVPVPAPPGLAPKGLGLDAKPDAPAADAAKAPETTAPAAPAEPPAKKTTRSRARAKTAPAPAEAADDGAATATPDAATADGTAAAETAEAASDDKPAAKKPRTTRKARKAEPALPPLPLSEDELARLLKLTPGSVRKLQNTLAAQFRTVDTEAAVAALAAHGILSIDRERVIWK